MEVTILEKKVKKIPIEARKEVSDYLDFLMYKYQNSKPVKPYAGCMKGTVIWISEDFNDSLDDFKEYM